MKPFFRAVAAQFNQILEEFCVSSDHLEQSSFGYREDCPILVPQANPEEEELTFSYKLLGRTSSNL